MVAQCKEECQSCGNFSRSLSGRNGNICEGCLVVHEGTLEGIVKVTEESHNIINKSKSIDEIASRICFVQKNLNGYILSIEKFSSKELSIKDMSNAIETCVNSGKTALTEQIIVFTDEVNSESDFKTKLTMTNDILEELKSFDSHEYSTEMKVIAPTIEKVEGLLLTFKIQAHVGGEILLFMKEEIRKQCDLIERSRLF